MRILLNGTKCCETGCDRRASRKYRCDKHYRKWRRLDPALHEQKLAANRDYRARNLDRIRAQERARFQVNPAKRIANLLRRHRQRAAGHITRAQWVARLNEFGNRCFYCGSVENLTMEHFRAIAAGGTHSIENVVPACRPCNVRKNCLHIINFLGKEARRRRLGVAS